MPDTMFLILASSLERAWPLIVFYGLILGFFYLFLIRPQAKRSKEHKDLLDALIKGDRVVTAGGIHGTIVRTKGNVVHLDIGKGILLRVDRSAIRRREGQDEE